MRQLRALACALTPRSLRLAGMRCAHLAQARVRSLRPGGIRGCARALVGCASFAGGCHGFGLSASVHGCMACRPWSVSRQTPMSCRLAFFSVTSLMSLSSWISRRMRNKRLLAVLAAQFAWVAFALAEDGCGVRSGRSGCWAPAAPWLRIRRAGAGGRRAGGS